MTYLSKSAIAMMLFLGLLCSCADTSKQNTVPLPKEDITIDLGADTVITVEDIKTEYEPQEETITYEEPMYNISKDYVFTYTNVSNRLSQQTISDSISVFYDSDLKEKVSITVDYDETKHKLKISPNKTFHYDNPENAGMLKDGTWGSRSKFWLVRNINLQTGQPLDIPVITVFTTKEELEVPTLTQSVDFNGSYRLCWTPIDGATCYKVYEYFAGTPTLQLTTSNTTCTYEEFQDELHRKNSSAKKKAPLTDMNSTLTLDSSYFVVAEDDNGNHSGLSNYCDVNTLANQIPTTISWDFPKSYEGNTALVLPAYVDITMADDSTSQFLIDYHDAKLKKKKNHTISIQCKIKNLPLTMTTLTFTGMDFEAFQKDLANVIDREDALATHSVYSTPEIIVPHFPSDTISTTPAPTEKLATPTEEPIEADTTDSVELAERLANSVTANSPMSAWIALQMLNHNEVIELCSFPECADSDALVDAIWEAYSQNPLIGIMKSAQFEYETNSLIIAYGQDAPSTKAMQIACLSAVDAILDGLLTPEMSDFEKEKAINQFLCEHGTYQTEIYEHINENGTLEEAITDQYPNAFTPYGILVDGTGVCESYAESFSLLSRAAGLDSVLVSGTLDGISHEWNRVKLEDQWYTLDVTNNDNVHMPNAYFNLSDELASTIYSEDNTSILDSHIEAYKATDMNYEYYTVNDLVFSDREAIISSLAKQLATSNVAAVRLKTDFPPAELTEMATEACRTAGLSTACYYHRAGVFSVVSESVG